MIWNETKWHTMKWKDVKGYEQILTEPNICKGLFTRMIGVTVLMWQRQAHATMTSIWGHFWPVYDLAWPKRSFWYVMLHNNYSIGLVEGTTSCFDLWVKLTQFWQASLSPVLMSGHAALSRSKVRSKMAFIHMHHTVQTQSKWMTFFLPVLAKHRCLNVICKPPWKGTSVNFFVWQFSIQTFHVQYQLFKTYLIN